MRDDGITVAAYYFPNWHPTWQNDAAHGKGWTEWEVVKCARPRFPGHVQPKIPLWGYEDESCPKAMGRKIAAARKYGIDSFVFDWYYGDEGPFREDALNKGFLKADNLGDMKFAVMWCNHARQSLHPAPYSLEVKTFSPAGLDPARYEAMTDHIVRDYLTHPNYWRIGGKPLFAVFLLRQVLRDFGSVDAAADALDAFREKARRAGLPGIHLHVMTNQLESIGKILSGADPAPEGDPLALWVGRPLDELVRRLRIDSHGEYNWRHTEKTFPRVDSEKVRRGIRERWRALIGGGRIPYYPNAVVGWDVSPRTVQSDMYNEKRGYPFSDVWSQTPEEFRSMLEEARRLLLARPAGERHCFIGCWNEWTEGAYLEPDTVNGYGFLEAVRSVFGVAPRLEAVPPTGGSVPMR